ncbi:MAG: DUF4340 domain-containing protein [Oscillospiraceae bacterium]
MAKLSKNTKYIVIAAAVLLILGAVLLVLLLTKPEETASASETSSEVSTAITVNEKSKENVLSVEVTNSHGSFSFERKSRVVSTTDSEGNVTSADEYYWESPQLEGLDQNTTSTAAFVNCFAGLTTKSLVEENAQDLAKYGLETPEAVVKLNFDDSTGQTLYFGIQNPAANNLCYFRLSDSSDVHQVSYYTVGDAYSKVNSFVRLSLTEAYNTENPQELDYMIIERKDLEEPLEIRYMYDLAALAEEEDSIVTTFNSHRFVKPFKAEIDTTNGKDTCYGIYGLAASSCEYISVTDEALAATGLDDPFCTVTAKYGGSVKKVIFGDPIVNIIETEDEDTPALATTVGYYGMLEGGSAIYRFDVSAVPWYTVTMQDIISRRPISPYIYTVDRVVIETPGKTYDFKITGDAQNNSFTCNGVDVDPTKFKESYQHLITGMGEELFFEEADYEPYVKVTFIYRDDYREKYGAEDDVIEFYQSDDRKSIVRVNGSVLFKVRQVYTERLIENAEAVLTGGEVQINW